MSVVERCHTLPVEEPEKPNGPIVCALRLRQPVSARTLSVLTGEPESVVESELEILYDQGVVRDDDEGWWLKEDRDRVCARRAGDGPQHKSRDARVRNDIQLMLDEQGWVCERTAAALLGVDRDVVAVATGSLLLSRTVRSAGPGRYVLARRP